MKLYDALHDGHCWANACPWPLDADSDRWCTHHVATLAADRAAALAWLSGEGDVG